MEIGTLTKLKLKVTVVTFGKTPGRKIARLIAPPPPPLSYRKSGNVFRKILRSIQKYRNAFL